MIAEDPTVEQQLRQLAARISVIAEAPGCSFIPSGRHIHESKDPTTGAGDTLSDAFQARLDSAGSSPYRLRELVEWTELQIKARTHSAPAPKRKLKDRVLEDYEGKSCREVAELEGNAVHFTTIWRWRQEAKLDDEGRAKVAA